MSLSAQQLNDIRAAYAIGHIKPIVEIAEQDVGLELDQAQYVALSSAEQDLLRRCNRYRTAALKACREGKYGIAEYLFHDIEKLLQTDMLPPMMRLMIQSTYEAAVAYLDYRCGRFEIGTAHIYRVLAYDETLEETYGLTSFHLHRIRQLLNLLRLKRRQGDGQEVIRLGVALMDYLEQKTSSLPFPTTWNSQCLNHLPLLAKNFLFEQTMCEVMFLIVCQENHYPHWLTQISGHTTVAASSHCQLSPLAHRWLQAKQALQAHHFDAFCERALPLITAGPTGSNWLWYGLIMDVVLLCKDLTSESAELLLQVISEDMLTWRWSKLPPTWKHIFETMSLRVHA